MVYLRAWRLLLFIPLVYNKCMVAITLTVGTVHDKIPAGLRAVLLKSVDTIRVKLAGL